MLSRLAMIISFVTQSCIGFESYRMMRGYTTSAVVTRKVKRRCQANRRG